MKPQPVLTEMPLLVKQIIVNYVDSWTKLSLSRCSKQLNHLVSKAHNEYQELYVHLGVDSIDVKLTYYNDHSNTIKFQHQGDVGPPHDETKNKDSRAAVLKIMTILGNPKVSLKCLRFRAYVTPERTHHEWCYQQRYRFFCILRKALASLEHQLWVQTLTMTFSPIQANIHDVLPFLRPGILETICLIPFGASDIVENVPRFFNRVKDLEQLKRIKNLRAATFMLDIPFEQWKLLNECYMGIQNLTLETVHQILQVFLDRPEARIFRFTSRDDIPRAVDEYFSSFQLVSQTEEESCYRIPQSTGNLKVVLSKTVISVSRARD